MNKRKITAIVAAGVCVSVLIGFTTVSAFRDAEANMHEQQEQKALYEQRITELEQENKTLRDCNKELEESIGNLEAQNERLLTLTASTKEDVVRVVMAESRGASLEGQMAVAQTILDRANAWDMKVSEVISQPNQYASPYNGKIADLREEAVDRIFLYGERVFPEETLFFHADYVHPYWADIFPVRGQIESHIFYGGEASV